MCCICINNVSFKANELKFEGFGTNSQTELRFDSPLFAHISTSLPERAIKPRIHRFASSVLICEKFRFYFLSSECTTFRGIFLHFPRHTEIATMFTPQTVFEKKLCWKKIVSHKFYIICVIVKLSKIQWQDFNQFLWEAMLQLSLYISPEGALCGGTFSCSKWTMEVGRTHSWVAFCTLVAALTNFTDFLLVHRVYYRCLCDSWFNDYKVRQI